MPRKLRVQFPGAMYHVMSRGDQRDDIFLDDVDRHDFIKTLAEASQKTGWQVHAFCLMRNHYHLVVETPNANLVAGMQWLQSTYTIRLNNRHTLTGHVLSGRYKAQLIEGGGYGYLRTACDYVHLNPIRAKLLEPEDRLLAYPWSSVPFYLAAQKHRPAWLRVDRLLGEHGIQQDTPLSRQEFERRMEARRLEPCDEESLKNLRRGWCLGGEGFRRQMLARMEGNLGEHHSGELHRASADAKAEQACPQGVSAIVAVAAIIIAVAGFSRCRQRQRTQADHRRGSDRLHGCHRNCLVRVRVGLASAPMRARRCPKDWDA